MKKAQSHGSAAKAAIAEATAIREKEAAEFVELSNELKTNIAAIGKAVDALRKGMGGAFLQTTAATTLKNLVENDQKMLDVDCIWFSFGSVQTEEKISKVSLKAGSHRANRLHGDAGRL